MDGKTYEGDWFTLQEREPEDRQQCLYWYDRMGHCYLGTWYANDRWFIGGTNAFADDVLAWQPLPERPMTTDEYLRHHGYDPDEIAQETLEIVERASKHRIYIEAIKAIVDNNEPLAREWLAELDASDLAPLARAAGILEYVCWDIYSDKIS